MGSLTRYSELLARLSRIGRATLEVYRREVGWSPGFEEWRERLSQLRASCDAARQAALLNQLAVKVEGGTVCVIGPRAAGVGECDVLGGPDAALAWSLNAGVPLDYVAGDGDASLRLQGMSWAAARLYFFHLHGDNWHRPPPTSVEVIYTTQVEPVSHCVLGPLGFTDGDRAVILALALGASKINLIGYWGPPEGGHKDWTPPGKTWKLSLAERFIVVAARAAGYRVEGRPPRVLTALEGLA